MAAAGEIRLEFQRSAERGNSAPVLFLLQVDGAEVHVRGGQVRRQFRRAFELADRRIEVSRGFGLQPCLDVLPQLRRDLERQEEHQRGNHSGSFTVRTRSTAMLSRTCRVPLGHRISTVARVAAPRPKCIRLSLAER